MNQMLLLARAYEEAVSKYIPPESRPAFHFSPRLGWTNDPNGFSFYKGKYHLFYQYNPYDCVWDAIHWGHAVSTDLLHWEYLPAVMAPDEDYDSYGCYSGSAVELDDGRQMLMYTGVRKAGSTTADEIQTQCIAVGDGLNYVKSPLNPVIDSSMIPAGLSVNNFRDPKIWREKDGSFRCIVGACDADELGTILLYSSPDGLRWTYEGVLAKNDGSLGRMWECPDIFSLDGYTVLQVSPQDMLPEGYEYHNGNGTVCMIGHLDEEGKRFTPEHHQAIDYGIDFYAPQTVKAPDGRQIMIGWMQNWDTCQLNGRKKMQWFGQMTLPRELSIKNGRLYQRPLRELEKYRRNRVEYRGVVVNGEMSLPGIEGRMVEMEITIRPVQPEKLYQKFAVWFAKNETYRTSLSFRPFESVVKVDRKFSGSRRAVIHQRRCLVPESAGCLKMRVILDRLSVEAFLNDGEQVMTATYYTDQDARGICFHSIGEVEMDIVKYDLCLEDEPHENV